MAGSARLMSLRSAGSATAPSDSEGPSVGVERTAHPSHEARTDEARPATEGRERFTLTAAVGGAVIAVPYLWVLWDQWNGRFDPLRTLAFSKFYDVQARAMLAGHLYLPPGSIGFEAFVHNGHQYTYFGLFPSLLRIPILLFTHALDGHLTAPSILLAWVVTAVFTSLLIWRVRGLARGSAPLGWGEAVVLGGLVATVLGGTVLAYLAATPFVYDEDFAWSVALSVATMFALLCVLERPTRPRITATAALLLATILNRTTTGYACALGVLLVAALFALGRRRADWRQWSIPLAALGALAVAVASFVNWIKFGLVFGISTSAQVFTSINAHRQAFLAANHGSEFGFQFLPSTLAAYFTPRGLALSRVFPYITLPPGPARAVGNVVLDLTYPTASVPASMPLLFLLSCWGGAATFRRGAGRLSLMRIPLIVMAVATAGVLLIGYIANRYLADFLPLLVVASVVGLVDILRRLPDWRAPARRGALVALGVLAGFEVFANVAVAVAPTANFTSVQAVDYVAEQKAISDITGHPLASSVVRGRVLPYWAPAGELYVVGDCAGLYISNGYDYQNTPPQQFEHLTWIALQSDSKPFALYITIQQPQRPARERVPILRFGRSSLQLQVASAGPRVADAFFIGQDPQFATFGSHLSLAIGKTYKWVVYADPMLHQLVVSLNNRTLLKSALTTTGDVQIAPLEQRESGDPAVSVAVGTLPPPSTDFCRSLVRP